MSAEIIAENAHQDNRRDHAENARRDRAEIASPVTDPPWQAAAHTDADERFVFIFSDANLERYYIRPETLGAALTAEPSVCASFICTIRGYSGRMISF